MPVRLRLENSRRERGVPTGLHSLSSPVRLSHRSLIREHIAQLSPEGWDPRRVLGLDCTNLLSTG